MLVFGADRASLICPLAVMIITRSKITGSSCNCNCIKGGGPFCEFNYHTTCIITGLEPSSFYINECNICYCNFHINHTLVRHNFFF